MENKNFEEWIDLSELENERTYHYPPTHDGPAYDYTIAKPQKLFVKESGSHKLVDGNGRIHYVTKGWRAFSADGTVGINVTKDKTGEDKKDCGRVKHSPPRETLFDFVITGTYFGYPVYIQVARELIEHALHVTNDVKGEALEHMMRLLYEMYKETCAGRMDIIKEEHFSETHCRVCFYNNNNKENFERQLSAKINLVKHQNKQIKKLRKKK